MNGAEGPGGTRRLEVERIWAASPVSRLHPGQLLIASDFDGTLAPIVDDPATSRPSVETAQALGRLAPLVRAVAVISGRAPGDLRRLLPTAAGVIRVGNQGQIRISQRKRELLAGFNRAASGLLGDLPGLRLELKPGGTAIHYRGTDHSASAIRSRIEPLLGELGLVASPGRSAIEVHPPGAEKGRALAAIIARTRPGSVVCLGDDENDRPLFQAARASGLPNLVAGVDSDAAPPGLLASADLVLADTGEVAAFFDVIAGWARSRLDAATEFGLPMQ